MYNDGMCVGLREVLLPIIPVVWLSTLYKARAINGLAAFSRWSASGDIVKLGPIVGRGSTGYYLQGGIMADTCSEFFSGLQESIDPEKIKGIDATYQWDITGDGGGKWYAKLSDSGVEVGEGEAESPSITLTVEAQNWMDIVNGKLNGQMAFLTGKLKIKGDMTLAMKLQSITG